MYEISQLESLEYQFGGIKRRIPEIRIDPLTLYESILYLAKLNDYCYNGKFIKSFVNPGASFNVLARMSMKNPGYMKSFFTNLMSLAGTKGNNNQMYQIDGRFIMENSKDFTLEYMETIRRAINIEIYNNWFNRFSNNGIIKGLLYLLIGEITLFSIDDLKSRFNKLLSDQEIYKAISEINQYINLIHPNIIETVLIVRKFKDGISRADIQNILKNKCGYNIDEINDFSYSIKFYQEGEIPLEQFLEPISYFDIDDNGEVQEKFFFSDDKDILKQIFPYLNNSTINNLKTEIKKYLDLENEYYTLNPNLFNIIFPLPIPQEYNLLEDKNENARLWTDISGRRKSEIYKKKINMILAEFLISEDIIEKNKNSKIRIIEDINYYNDVIDENNFIILEDYFITELSNNPINILIWRENSEYNKNIINDIINKVELYQKKELKNIHLIFLISLYKINNDLLKELDGNLDYSIIIELNFSQFDISKYTFLYEIKKKYTDYNTEKYNKTLKNLINPIKPLINSCKKNIKQKGLSIELNNYPSKLKEIPELLKYILYDFDNDFKDYENLKFKKPFEKINPIGLKPDYSSSIDDWGQEKLRSSINEFLLVNKFITLDNNSLKISMPKIESKIFQLLKDFSRYNQKFKVNNLRFFFFDKSKSPKLLNDVFLTDLKNRGLI
ncbi:MAG: hypothetical protein ACP6IY_22820, partial [Promethearchaeia archaeon]